MKKEGVLLEIIIYGSEYGTAKSYAKELARLKNAPCYPYDRVQSIKDYHTVIYIGSLYAGGVLGLKKTLKKHDFQGKRLLIVTVGLANPKDEKNIMNIQSGIRRQVGDKIFESAEIYHLRGGIDYAKLHMLHKVLMGLLYRKAMNMPETEKTPEVQTMLETYGKKVNFVDFSSLDEIIKK